MLDSIAKNVGTPYTLFFQRNLYNTFMGAYTVVETPVRRKLEEMLHTWKQPVPGSTSPQPVFPPEATRKIDNALIRARTAALQLEQKKRQAQSHLNNLTRPASRTTTPPQQLRDTPPPPQAGMGFDYGRSATATPSDPTGRHTVGGEKSHFLSRAFSYTVQPVMNTRTLVPTPQPPYSFPSQLGSMPFGSGNVDLISDINRLIETTEKSFRENPYNSELQQRLQALVDLRSILQTQQLPDAQLAQVREQVRKIANPTPPPLASIIAPPPPMPPAPQFSTQDLAALLASTAVQQSQLPIAPAVPPPTFSLPVSLAPLPAPLPPPVPAPAAMANPASSLFDSLRQFGLLPGAGGAQLVPPPPTVTAAPLPFNIPTTAMLASVTGRPGNVATPPPPPLLPAAGNKNWRLIDVDLRSASLKM